MNFILLTAGLVEGALAAAAVAPRACGGDNCGRAVRATQYGPASSAAHLNACNTYLRATVTPEASTVYITMTDSTTITIREDQPTGSPQASSPLIKKHEPFNAERRDASSTTKKIPAYASPCSNAAAYSSACVCFGAKVSTVTDDPDTVTSVITVTATRTVQDSPPRSIDPSAVTQAPPPTDFTATYTWEEATLPTFDTMTQPIPMPSPTHVEPKCMIEAADLTNTEFYLLDQRVGYLFNRGDRPGPPVAPTTEEEARIKSDPANFHPPTYRFEKPSGAPAGLYDLVLVDGGKKLYVATRGTAGEVIFTDSSTNGAVKARLLTTMFGVTCKGYLVAKQRDVIYDWRALDDGTGTKLTTAAGGQQAADTIVLLPKAMADVQLRRRSYATQDAVPRCVSDHTTINYPVEVIAQLKRGARGNNPNGCGPNNGMDFVPDWSFGRCCDNHDNCYDDCGKTFGQCNGDFYNCMRGKCGELVDIWNFWLRPACEGMAAFYYSVVQLGGQDAFNQANQERCECVCPNTPQGLSQSLCQTTKPDADCVMTGGDDNMNCGGCGWACPSKTHCSRGNCACDGDTCGNLCLNLLTHPRNCGRCGNVCKSGYCWQGSCYDPPAVPDVCYPVDGIANGDFSSGVDGWAVGYPQWGSIIAVGDSSPLGLGTTGATILFTLGAGTASFSQDVRLCEGTAYELDFSATRQSARKSCAFDIRIGDQSIASRPFSSASLTKLAYGPYPVPTLKSGDPRTYKDGVYLRAPLYIAISCDAGETIEVNDFSLHIA